MYTRNQNQILLSNRIAAHVSAAMPGADLKVISVKVIDSCTLVLNLTIDLGTKTVNIAVTATPATPELSMAVAAPNDAYDLEDMADENRMLAAFWTSMGSRRFAEVFTPADYDRLAAISPSDAASILIHAMRFDAVAVAVAGTKVVALISVGRASSTTPTQATEAVAA